MKSYKIGSDTLWIASSFWDRTRGIIGREEYLRNGVMFILNCKWVHSIFVRENLNLFFVNSELKIVRQIGIKKNSLSPIVWNAYGVVETSEGFPLDRVEAMLYYLRTLGS